MSTLQHLPFRLEKTVPALGFISYFTTRKPIEETKNPIPGLITQADSLFENEQYFEAYDLLSAYKVSFIFKIEVL